MKRPRSHEPHPPSSEEADIFRAAVSDAVPLAAPARHVARRRPPPPVPVQSLLDHHAVLDESLSPLDSDHALETGDEENWVREGISRQSLRLLRRGHWVVQSELDLHGMTREEARESLALFLRESVKHGRRCVRVIHGKGHGSPGRAPVLKGKVKVWLARREEVLAFCQAPPRQGGGGALLVLLKA